MSLKPCDFTIEGKTLSYDQMRQYLLSNPDVWKGYGGKVIPIAGAAPKGNMATEDYIKDTVVVGAASGGWKLIDSSNIKKATDASGNTKFTPNEGAGSTADIRIRYSDEKYELILDQETTDSKELFRDINFFDGHISSYRIKDKQNGKTYLVVSVTSLKRGKGLDSDRNGQIFVNVEDTGNLPSNILTILKKRAIDEVNKAAQNPNSTFEPVSPEIVNKINAQYEAELKAPTAAPTTKAEEGSSGVGGDVQLTQEQKVNETTKALDGIDKTDLEFISRKENNRRKGSFYEKAKGILFKGFGGNASIISDKFGSKYKYFTDNPDYAKSFSLEKEYLTQNGKVEKYETDYKKQFNTNEKDYNNEVLKHSGKKNINDLTSKDFDNFNDKLKADGYDVVNIKRNEPLIPSEAYKGHSADIRNVEVEEHLILNDKAIKKIADQPSLLENNAKSISEAYHKAKKDDSNPELVKAVEEALAPTTPAESSFNTPLTPTGIDAQIATARALIADAKRNPTSGGALYVLLLKGYIGILQAAKAAKRVITQAQAMAEARAELKDNHSAKELDDAMSSLETTLGFKNELEYFTDYVDSKKAAASLTPAQAKELMDTFKTILDGPEALEDAIDVVDKLVTQKDLLNKINKARELYKQVKKAKGSKRLTISDKQFIAGLAKPNFFKLDSDVIDNLNNMMNHIINTKIGGKASTAFTDAQIDAAFNQAYQQTKPTPKPKRAGVKTKKFTEVLKSAQDLISQYKGQIPELKLLDGVDLTKLHKDDVYKLINAIRTFEETGEIFDIGNIAQKGKMLTKVGSMGRSGVQTIGKTLTLGGWTNILQNRTTNADTIRANTLGPFSSKNAANQVEIEQERLDINKQFIKLGITTTPDFFDLGTYAFFKENTPGQSPQFKAERMADHFNELWNGIKSSKETASDKNVVAEKEYYYNQSVAALKRMGILSGTDGNLSANPTFDIEKVSDKIKKAHDYGIKLLDKYTAAYAHSLNSYHGKDFVPIESYWPRSYEKEFTDEDPTVGGTVMPTLAGLGQFPGGVSGEVATRNKGRVAMPKAGGFYNLDGFQTLVNGLADIHSTINLSPDLAYVSALVNEGGLDAIIEKAMTRNSFKKFIISSIDGMLGESVMNAPDQNKARKLLGSIGQNVTSSILNNPTQYGKQPMSLIQAAAVNPIALGRAIALYNNPNPKVKAAVQKFLDQTTFSYTDRLAYIELENSIQAPSKASEAIDNIQAAVRKYSGGDALIQSNRMTQGVLLLSGYLNSKKGKIDIVSEAAKGFTDEDVAAGEQMAEMANAPADRHLLAQQLKDHKNAKKYLYYLQTFTFSGVANFYNNIKIASSRGYSPAAKSLALRNAVGFVGQQLAFQAMSEAIARILIAIAGPDEDEEEARRRLLLKMRAANITIDLATGTLPGFWGAAAKALASTLFLMAEGKAEDIPETPKDEARVPALKSFNKSDIPGAVGVIWGTGEKMYKAAEAEDKDAILIAALGAAAMVANQGTFKLLADKNVNHIIDVLNTTGSSEALKGFRHDNPDTYMAWVSDLRKQGLVSSDYSKFARKGILDNQIDYLDSKDATKFMKIYNDAYKNTYQKLAKGGLSTKDAVETSKSIALVLAQYNDNIHFKTITIKPE